MLVDVYRAVKADFAASGCAAQVLFGKTFIARNDDANRVVFVPTNDAAYLSPLSSQGAGIPPPAMSAGANPRAVMRRSAGAEIHIWGAAAPNEQEPESQLERDYDVLNALINQTALSLYRVACGVVKILGGGNDNRVVEVRRGFVYVMRITVEIPIVDIDFPPKLIDECVFTWLTAPAVADVTVEMRQSLPTGPLMSTVSFTTEPES